MVVLRTDDGRTFVGHDVINTLIAPTRIDAVPVPTGIDALLTEPELTAQETAQLLAHADAGVEAERTARRVATADCPGVLPWDVRHARGDAGRIR